MTVPDCRKSLDAEKERSAKCTGDACIARDGQRARAAHHVESGKKRVSTDIADNDQQQEFSPRHCQQRMVETQRRPKTQSPAFDVETPVRIQQTLATVAR